MLNISQKLDLNFRLENEKNVLYSEIQYILSVRNYCNKYIKFYNSLSKKEKTIYEAKKNNATKLLEVVSIYPIQEMLYHGRVGHYLSLQNKVKLKKEVFDFIVNHPQFSKPFDDSQVLRDLMAAAKI